MINQQLLDYVRAQKSAGLSKEAIVQALAAGGWTANDVNEAFMAIEGVRTPPPPPPPPPQPVGPRTIVPPPGAPAVAPPPLSSAPRPPLAATEFSTGHIQIKKRGGIGKWVLIILIIILLILGGIGALAFINPSLVASYIPAIEMFFPPEPAPEAAAPVDTTPVATTSIEASLDVSTTTPTTTPQ